MVGDEGVASTFRKILLPFDVQMDIVIFDCFLEELYSKITLPEYAVQMILVNEAFKPRQDRGGDFPFKEYPLDNCVQIEGNSFVTSNL